VESLILLRFSSERCNGGKTIIEPQRVPFNPEGRSRQSSGGIP
jgi:hypothetical protein